MKKSLLSFIPTDRLGRTLRLHATRSASVARLKFLSWRIHYDSLACGSAWLSQSPRNRRLSLPGSLRAS
ncbi:MAG: hypothetical protein NDJ90_00320 [Oligoflexia bacterium]|nr:hypothetical protein [Oligoflexia bacterium]